MRNWNDDYIPMKVNIMVEKINMHDKWRRT